ncbi:MAG: Mov34/MPN/PAD-1 family protein [Candidatus Bathyarchaeota archaeon B26-2]|nr:MAG: Mov34/MPN/PAD-1 family protein [Candidatus Bathyarchaeota archaeon B26-2]
MKRRLIYVKRSVIRSILEYAKACHPKEGILLLKGSIKRDRITVDEVEIPPLAVRGFGFSNFPLYMLPVDFSIVGTAHSHPSGVLRPSIVDLNKFYGRIMVIAAYPYMSEEDIAIFDGEGKVMEYEVVADV